MKKISIVITASGHAKRFGSNKLLADLNGKPVIQYTFEAIPGRIEKTIVVAWDREILDLAESFGFTGVYNDDKTDDPSITVKLGMENLPHDTDGCMLLVADQPLLTKESLNNLCALYDENPSCICAVSEKGEQRNPVIYPKFIFPEFMGLPPFERGKAIIKKYRDILRFYEVPDSRELMDVDYIEDLNKLINTPE